MRTVKVVIAENGIEKTVFRMDVEGNLETETRGESPEPCAIRFRKLEGGKLEVSLYSCSLSEPFRWIEDIYLHSANILGPRNVVWFEGELLPSDPGASWRWKGEITETQFDLLCIEFQGSLPEMGNFDSEVTEQLAGVLADQSRRLERLADFLEDFDFGESYIPSRSLFEDVALLRSMSNGLAMGARGLGIKIECPEHTAVTELLRTFDRLGWPRLFFDSWRLPFWRLSSDDAREITTAVEKLLPFRDTDCSEFATRSFLQGEENGSQE